MRHNYKGRKLGTDASHTKAMKRSLTAALLYNDRIKTTEARAKEIRSEVDRIITWAKKGDLHSRRLAMARLGNDKELVREVFEKVAQDTNIQQRPGGYTRIMKLGPRKGDGAPMVIIELLWGEPVSKKSKTAAEPKKVAKAKKAEKVEKAEELIEDGIIDVEAEAMESEEAAEELAEVAEEVKAEAEEAVEAADEAGDAEAAAEAAEVAEKAAEVAEAAEEAVEDAEKEAGEITEMIAEEAAEVAEEASKEAE